MSQPLLSVLIPAAGASKRLGQAKQLVRYKHGTLMQHAVSRAQSIAPLEIIVITGANAEAVQNVLPAAPVRWVHNPHWPDGMGASIAAGADKINPDSNGVMILLCDQWRVRTEDLQALVTTWHRDPGRIVIAQAGGKNMPPVIFPSRFFTQLRALTGDRGAHNLLHSHTGLMTAVTVENAAYDLDTQAHLELLRNTDL